MSYPLFLSRRLALFISCLQANAHVGSRGIHRATVLFQKRARAATRDHQAAADVALESLQHFVNRLLSAVAVCRNQFGLPHDIKVIGFDNQMPFAAGATLIARV